MNPSKVTQSENEPNTTDGAEAPASAASSGGGLPVEKFFLSTFVNLGLSVGLKVLLFAQSIVFLRLFSPDDLKYYNSALLSVTFLMLLGQTGAYESVIRNRGKDDDGAVMDTAFTLTLVWGILLFLTAFFGVPALADRGGNGKEALAPHIRFLAFLTLNSALLLPSALWAKDLRFGLIKIPMFIEVAVTTGTALFLYQFFGHGIWRYFGGLGIWSLLWGRLAGFVANYASLWILAPRRPRPRWSPPIARSCVIFGWPILANTLCNYLSSQGDQWLILGHLGKEKLTYYIFAFTLTYYIREIVDLASQSIFPFFSRVQETRAGLAYAFSVSNKFLAMMVIPLGGVLFLFAEPIILHVYQRDWLPAAPLLKIFALGTVFNVILGYNWGSLALVSGRTRKLFYVNLWSVGLLATLGNLLVYYFREIGGALFGIIQAALTTLVFRFPIIFREIGTLGFLRGLVKPLAAGAAAGTVAYFFFVPFAESIWRLLAAASAFGALYLVILVALDRSLIEISWSLWKGSLGKSTERTVT